MARELVRGELVRPPHPHGTGTRYGTLPVDSYLTFLPINIFQPFLRCGRRSVDCHLAAHALWFIVRSVSSNWNRSRNDSSGVKDEMIDSTPVLAENDCQPFVCLSEERRRSIMQFMLRNIS